LSETVETSTKKNFSITEVDFILLVSLGSGIFVVILLVLIILLAVECNRRKRLQKLLKENTDSFESSAFKMQSIEQQRIPHFTSISETPSKSQNQEYVNKVFEQNYSDDEDEIDLEEEIRI
jgi:hypothetical protein